MADILGLIGIAAAFFVPGIIEYLEKPRIEIIPVSWVYPGRQVYPMAFASAEVRNKPLAVPFRFLSRRPAEACQVLIDFWTWGPENSRVRVLDTITGRWDSHPQPLRLTPASLPASKSGRSARPAAVIQYDPHLIQSQQDIAVGSDRGRISVAVLRDGEAFAFGDESYADEPAAHLGKKEWQLSMGTTYRIEIHVSGSNADYKQAFKLEFLNDEFDRFQLQPAESRRAAKKPKPRRPTYDFWDGGGS
jgi:hypothetical protein